MKNCPITYGVVVPEMIKRKAICAVYGIQFHTYKEMATDLEDILYFETYKDFIEWRDLLPKIYDGHESPTLLYVYHRL